MKIKAFFLSPNFWVFTVTSILCLLFAEIALRIVFPIDTSNLSIFRIPNAIYGWSLKPNSVWIRTVEGNIVEVRYNEQGWRDTDHRFENTESRQRILVLGDSFMEAYSVDINDALPKKLQALAKNEGQNIETINLGVGGYGTLQQYQVFHTIGAKYTPDIVLLGFFLSNDLVDNSAELEALLGSETSKIRPYLVYQDLPAWNISQIDYEGAMQRYKKALAEKPIPLLGGWQTNSVLFETLGSFTDSMKYSFIYKLDLQDDYYKNRKKNWSDKEAFPRLGVYYCDEPEEYTRAWQVTNAILQRLNEDVENSGAKLVVFSVPARKEVEKLSMRQAINAAKNVGRDICLEGTPKPYAQLENMLNELNIEYVDLLPAFKREDMQGNRLFYNTDRHWNKQGHHLAAREVYDFLY